jgi:hypothetical protein
MLRPGAELSTWPTVEAGLTTPTTWETGRELLKSVLMTCGGFLYFVRELRR